MFIMPTKTLVAANLKRVLATVSCIKIPVKWKIKMINFGI